MSKKILIWYLLAITATVPLALFFTGPNDLAQNMDRPGQVMPAGSRFRFEMPQIPAWWNRFELIIRHESNQNCADLRGSLRPHSTEIKPIHCNRGNAFFAFQTTPGLFSEMTLINPTPVDLVIGKLTQSNYSAIDTGPPLPWG